VTFRYPPGVLALAKERIDWAATRAQQTIARNQSLTLRGFVADSTDDAVRHCLAVVDEAAKMIPDRAALDDVVAQIVVTFANFTPDEVVDMDAFVDAVFAARPALRPPSLVGKSTIAAPSTGASATPPVQTIAEQLQALKTEARWTIEKLADETHIDRRNVARHLSGETQPRPDNIGAYEVALTRALGRPVKLTD
jgi:hypothetical protein